MQYTKIHKKICKYCKKEFYSNHKDTLYCCKKCYNIFYRENNVEKFIQLHKKWDKNNILKRQEMRKKWKEKNPEKDKALSKLARGNLSQNPEILKHQLQLLINRLQKLQSKDQTNG